MRPTPAALLALVLLAGCLDPPDGAHEPGRCTLVDFEQGVVIDVVSPSAAVVRVDVAARGEAFAVDTRGGGAIAGRRDLVEVAVTPARGAQPTHIRVGNLDGLGGPEELTVTLRRADLTITRTLHPRYTDREPGGPGCGIARNARETIELP